MAPVLTDTHAQGRLHVFGLDLRDLARLEEFCAMLKVAVCMCMRVVISNDTINAVFDVKMLRFDAWSLHVASESG